MKKEQLILIGGGGHCESVVDTLRTLDQYEVMGILDLNKKLGEKVDGIPVIGTDEQLDIYYQQGIKNIFITLGAIGSGEKRKYLYTQCKKIGYCFPNIIDPSAICASYSLLGEGIFVGKGSIINSNVQIGNGSIINSGAIIEHGCRIKQFVHVAPGATVCGNVSIGEYTHIGAHAVIIQNIDIGNDVVIGAGSVVVRNINAHSVAYGNPCKEMKHGTCDDYC